MCGIAGFCLNKDERFNARKVSEILLNEIVIRGEDATGCAWVQPTDSPGGRPTIAVSKAPVPADLFSPYLEKMPTKTQRVILHTRWATQGSPSNNLNNHPIVSGKIVGVHNGHLSNDKAVFKNLRSERRAQVDSEAAFALIDQTKYAPADVLRSLEGRASLAWLDARDKRDLHLARCDGSPLAIGSTVKGSFFFASTRELLERACDKAKVNLAWCEDVLPYTYLRIRNGEIVAVEDIGKSLKAIA